MATFIRSRWGRGSVASLIGGVVLAVAFADPAIAADELQVSPDGVVYADTLPSPLFDGLPVLVPNDSVASSFFVRNSGPTEAYLAVTIANPTWSDADLANAVTVGASAPGNAGRTAVLSSATACTVLLDGYALGAGQSVQVTLRVAIGDLSGTAGQNASAGMDAGLYLTETAGLPAGPACAIPPTTVVVVPRAPARPGAGAAPATGGDSDPVVVEEEPQEEPASPIEELAIVLTNTLSSFDPVAVAFATAAVPAGAALFMIVGRVRRRRGDLTEETP